MASFHKSLYLFSTFFFALLSFSNAYTYNVGGKDGWTLHPSENYNERSGKLRFIVNDSLRFKYDAGSDSVMVVSNGDYDNCNTNNPITTLTGGDSTFNLNRSGPFYFISGNKSHCDQGQKLEVVVISPKTHSGAPSPAGVSPGPTTSPVLSPPEPGATPMGSPVSSPPEYGMSPMGSPYASPPEYGMSPMGSPFASPPEPGTTPAASPGGGISASPTGNPDAMNGPSPGDGLPDGMNGPSPGDGLPASASARLQFSSTLSVSLVVMIFGLGWLFY